MTHATHILKTHPAVFEAVQRGAKNFEVRKDDRAFQAGDIVKLVYFDPSRPPLTQSEEEAMIDVALVFRIGFVLRGGQYGVETGYVAFSLLPYEEPRKMPDYAIVARQELTEKDAKDYASVKSQISTVPDADGWRQHSGKHFSDYPENVESFDTVEAVYFGNITIINKAKDANWSRVVRWRPVPASE